MLTRSNHFRAEAGQKGGTGSGPGGVRLWRGVTSGVTLHTLLFDCSLTHIIPVLTSIAMPQGEWKRALVPTPSAFPAWPLPARV